MLIMASLADVAAGPTAIGALFLTVRCYRQHRINKKSSGSVDHGPYGSRGPHDYDPSCTCAVCRSRPRLEKELLYTLPTEWVDGVSAAFDAASDKHAFTADHVFDPSERIVHGYGNLTCKCYTCVISNYKVSPCFHCQTETTNPSGVCTACKQHLFVSSQHGIIDGKPVHQQCAACETIRKEDIARKTMIVSSLSKHRSMVSAVDAFTTDSLYYQDHRAELTTLENKISENQVALDRLSRPWNHKMIGDTQFGSW